MYLHPGHFILISVAIFLQKNATEMSYVVSLFDDRVCIYKEQRDLTKREYLKFRCHFPPPKGHFFAVAYRFVLYVRRRPTLCRRNLI
jgi:hypothetical protein